MNKIFIAIVVVAIAVAGGYFLFNGGAPQPTPIESINKSYQKKLADLEKCGPQPGAPGNWVCKDGRWQLSDSTTKPIDTEKVIIYTDTGYSPSSLEIKTGDSVVFKNNSSQAMWSASAMHPSHKDYPTTGGCLGSTFDACKGVQPGENWSFKFDIAGDWKYHDHLSPKNFGAIIVK